MAKGSLTHYLNLSDGAVRIQTADLSRVNFPTDLGTDEVE
jgi:hypothetical protein